MSVACERRSEDPGAKFLEAAGCVLRGAVLWLAGHHRNAQGPGGALPQATGRAEDFLPWRIADEPTLPRRDRGQASGDGRWSLSDRARVGARKSFVVTSDLEGLPEGLN